jgi:hypothetical protein
MKWLKFFENYSNEYPIWQMYKDGDVYVYYFKIDRNFFKLTFSPVKKLPGFWLRNITEETNKLENIFSGRNALKIFPIIANIVEDFIKKEYPDVIVIPHIPSPNERGVLNSLNKRAKYNYQQLKNIQGYHLQYFNEYFKYYPNSKPMYGPTKTTTVGFLMKNGTSKSPEDFFNIPQVGCNFGKYVHFPVEP